MVLSHRIAIVASFAVLGSVAAAQTTAPIAVTSAGVPSFPGQSVLTGMSANGRFVVFESGSKLTANDTNTLTDIYLHDRATGVPTLVSYGGVPANAHSYQASVSADGRWVTFHSAASNLIASDVNAGSDVFVYDAQSGALQFVNVDNSGSQLCCGVSAGQSISADGRYVVFNTNLALVPNDTNGFTDAYVRDLVAQTTERVSVDLSGGDGDSGVGSQGWRTISDDGRYVLFTSTSSDLVANDTNGALDVFVRDRLLGTTERASLDFAGAQIANWSVAVPFATLSGNGRVVAWSSQVESIVPPDVLGNHDVFLRDLDAGVTLKVTVGAGGAEADGDSSISALSFDGSTVVFSSNAQNIVPGSAPGVRAFAFDRVTGTYSQVEIATTGQQPNGFSTTQDALAVSSDGQIAAFSSHSTNLVPLTLNPRSVYVHDASVYSPVAGYCAAKANSLGCIPRIGASSFPSLTGFDAFWISASAVRNQKSGLLFWGTGPASLPFAGGTLCVAPPVVRTAVQSSNGNALPANDCSGLYTLHFSQSYMASQAIAAGQALYAQYWSRDPGFAPPNNVGLTDALSFLVLP